MSRKSIKIGVAAILVVVLAVIAITVVACGGTSSSSTTAASTVTSATTASTEATSSTGAVSSTETTAPAGSTTTAAAAPATGEPIKIGVNIALTGHAAIVAPDELNAMKLEVKVVNAAGGVNGRPITLDIVDNKSDPATAVSVMDKLITQDKVVAVLGPGDTACSLAAVPVAEKYGVPMVRIDGGEVNDTFKNPKWSFLAVPPPQEVNTALLAQIKAAGWKNILAIGDTLPANQDILKLLKGSVDSVGAKITVMSDTWALDATDLTPINNKIYAQYQSVKPDVIFVMSVPTQAPMIMKGLTGLGVTVPIQGGNASAHTAIFAMGASVMEGYRVIGTALLNPSALPDDNPAKALAVELCHTLQSRVQPSPLRVLWSGLQQLPPRA